MRHRTRIATKVIMTHAKGLDPTLIPPGAARATTAAPQNRMGLLQCYTFGVGSKRYLFRSRRFLGGFVAMPTWPSAPMLCACGRPRFEDRWKDRRDFDTGR